ncbi:MAG: SH3 domain-containing protein [Bacteroidetes bacterium]|nr:SH3 domain-containing protein [Bacteroidota bacterium]MDA1119880.1 SH3 domain-containing protein [Bacteroidota bacterium]
MNKNQKQTLAFKLSVALIAIQFFLCTSTAFSEGTIDHADSLFKAGKFTESFKVYESVLAYGNYSTEMLIRMAYIKEGLGDYSNALYFLNLYYDKTSDKRVWSKMQELADENDLIGYNYGDVDFLLNFYRQYRQYILLVLAIFSIILMVGILKKRIPKEPRPVTMGIVNILVLLALFTLMNFSAPSPKGIITGNDTYLMSGPSSGAEVIDILQKGHRVDVLEDHEIWIKIIWENKEVYIRKSKIRQLG